MSRGMVVADQEATSAPLIEEGQAIDDGAAAVQAKHKQLYIRYSVLMGVYIVFGLVFFGTVEEWNPLESMIFMLSILTGIGYGHLVPQYPLGLVVAAFYIVCGLVLFATIAGQILEFIMESEIGAVLDAVKTGATNDDGADENYRHAQKVDKKHQFVVGCINIAVVYTLAVLVFIIAFGEGVVDSIYLASVSVLKLDSVCLLPSVQCSHGRQTHSGGSTPWLLFAIVWYIFTYGIIGHFLVSASNYWGIDPKATVSHIKGLSHERLQRMDVDGDGQVTRDEFLRDRLIRDKICEAEAIDAILRNFDHLDKDQSGHLNHKDTANLEQE